MEPFSPTRPDCMSRPQEKGNIASQSPGKFHESLWRQRGTFKLIDCPQSSGSVG